MATSPGAALPIIDVSGLSSREESDRHAVASAIHAACIDRGFFYIKGHGIPAGLIDAVFAETRAFFDQPEALKREVAKTNSFCNRGWEPLRAQALEPGTPPDLKENFYLGRDLPLHHPSVVARKFNHGPNQWPAGMLSFRPTMRAYYEAMLDLSERVMAALAIALDLPPGYLDTFHEAPMATLRLLHYPPQPPDALAGQKGVGAHTDFGVLTFLLQDENGGLQVQDQGSGTWLDVTPIPGTYVVNLGDTIARWTNDRYRSTRHRVINTSGRRRYSIPFFFNGNPDYLVECLPGCLAAGESPRYRPNTVAGHMREMYERSYALPST
jgi:isopenicillin N synthase-like dioxygenase